MRKIRKKLFVLFVYAFQVPRKIFYRLISPNRPVSDWSKKNQPVMFVGDGRIDLGRCFIGVWPSPGFFFGYAHIEARGVGSVVEIGDGVWINNGATIIADKTCISIGANTLIGTNFTAYDSDFHDLHPARRFGGNVSVAPVSIGRNVFIGSSVTILKGVSIGENSVIASGSIVSSDIPRDSIAAGVPAKVIGRVPE